MFSYSIFSIIFINIIYTIFSFNKLLIIDLFPEANSSLKSTIFTSGSDASFALDGNSKSPISLLELGLYGPQGKLICFCTKDFYRYNNVKCTCDKYLIDLYETSDIKKVADEIASVYNEIMFK